MVVVSETWETVIRHFQGNKDLKPLEELVRYLAGSDYQSRLYRVVFLESLILCAYNPFSLFSYSLQIDYADGMFRCSWYGKAIKEWEERIPGDQMISRFPELAGKVTWY